ncbi:CRISPR system precrRNA processing endoribonuclease RAMP protein Cas6 [Haloterrigena alkaliphila]|uniref:CRISPR system precrRNA processing endoribonuclease RAMP protein Cas6 n=1 Tax=Haloterrigena alkaliphila TaxID=2816475 RepID=UPI001CECDCFF|nr:CRISPR system precrRNA processing endoribonuclease RAMP protein Cas6 [Haloterrigena alkaliphila]QSX00461.2 CRISPR system precrRNA processing endoribonuclease RAMP protein Cas6 [Haloterrigena alkaliphila]
MSQRLHDSSIGSLHNSGLLGSFSGSDRRHHKQVDKDEHYDLRLGVTDADDQEVFEALAEAFVFGGDSLELADGEFVVADFASTNATHEELLTDAAAVVDDLPPDFEIEMRFRTPTCIREADEITAMFPARGTVFRSLLRKWNKTVPEEQANELELGLVREDFEANLIEKPDEHAYDTDVIMVNRGEDGKPILRQGFLGSCTYKFKDASEAVRTATTALASFAEFGGVGSSVARGCGYTEVKINS